METLAAPIPGTFTVIDNRRLSRLAKLAGAPQSPAAGVRLQVRLGDAVRAGQPLLQLHAQSPGELAYALDYFHSAGPIITVAG